MQTRGYKAGNLTKRGKLFGSWKTRYYVVQGPTLEYFDVPDGKKLGSIALTGALIGRQRGETEVYKHALLVVDALQKRHVFCAESEADRNAWVHILSRWVDGTYIDDTSYE